jgi:hypothetical protein
VVNVKSAMARFGLGPTTPPSGFQNGVEYIAWFRFPVTWTYLAEATPEAVPVLHIKPATGMAAAPAVMTLISTAPTLTLFPADAALTMISGDACGVAAGAQWEMVIPKMSRPPVVDRLTAPPPRPATISAPAAPLKDTATPEYVPPSLLQAAPEGTFLNRYWRQIALAGGGALILGCLLSGNLGGGASAHKMPAAWSHRYSSPPGRLLSLYEPSRGEADYSLEFGWVPDAKGAGLVLRVRDENNYYATRLVLQQRAPSLELAEDHFSVLGGVEGAHSRKIISLRNQAGPVQILMDAIGSALTLSVQGRPVDYWNDGQLSSGALGFFDDTGDRPDVQGLHFTFIKKGATRTAVASLP